MKREEAEIQKKLIEAQTEQQKIHEEQSQVEANINSILQTQP
jgi:hypothetical protein